MFCAIFMWVIFSIGDGSFESEVHTQNIVIR
jgi:hypothetical protein